MTPRLRRLTPLVSLATLFAVAITLGAPQEADARRRKKKKTVAVFPFIERDNPDPAVSEAVYGLLSKASALIKNLTVVTDTKLKKKLRKDPAKLIAGCGSNLKCIAKLGRKARANEALIAMVSPDDAGGVKISFLAVDVRKKKVARKNALVFASVDDVKSVLGGAFYDLFGITDPGLLEVKGIDKKTLVRVGGKLVGKGPGPHKVPPGRHEVEIGDYKDTVMIMPDKTKTIEVSAEPAAEPEPEPEPEPSPMVASAEPEAESGDELPLEPPAGTEGDSGLDDLALVGPGGESAEPPPEEVASSSDGASADGSAEGEIGAEGSTGEETTEIAAVSPDEGTPIEMTPPPPKAERGISPGILTWVGAGVGGAGLILAGVGGGVTGSEATSLRDGISPSTHTQLEAIDQFDQANGMADTSTALFISGAVVAAAGAALAIIDLFVLQGGSDASSSSSSAAAYSPGFEF